MIAKEWIETMFSIKLTDEQIEIINNIDNLKFP